MRMHFLPHKFGRVLLPWLILTGIGATFALPGGWIRSTLLAMAVVVLALAALDLVLPVKFILRRLTSPARSFVLLNAASLASVLVFFVPPERLWKPTRVAHDAADTLLTHRRENKPWRTPGDKPSLLLERRIAGRIRARHPVQRVILAAIARPGVERVDHVLQLRR